jgi:hypothetical protein
MNATPLKTLTDAAKRTRKALGLNHNPVVIRDEACAHRIAAMTSGHAVMLGEGAYWVVCLADAQRLERAGFEYAPR